MRKKRQQKQAKKEKEKEKLREEPVWGDRDTVAAFDVTHEMQERNLPSTTGFRAPILLMDAEPARSCSPTAPWEGQKAFSIATGCTEVWRFLESSSRRAREGHKDVHSELVLRSPLPWLRHTASLSLCRRWLPLSIPPSGGHPSSIPNQG